MWEGWDCNLATLCTLQVVSVAGVYVYASLIVFKFWWITFTEKGQKQQKKEGSIINFYLSYISKKDAKFYKILTVKIIKDALHIHGQSKTLIPVQQAL